MRVSLVITFGIAVTKVRDTIAQFSGSFSEKL